jgi:transcriptional regulator with XRE-family HTH domain
VTLHTANSTTREVTTSSALIADDDRAMFGEFLSSARRRAGRSIEDIASITKLSRRYLEALEHGRVEVLPPGMYRRAMLRSYAASVALDPQVALERFDRTFTPPAPVPERRPEASAMWPRPASVFRPFAPLRPVLTLSSFPALALPSFREATHLRLPRTVLNSPLLAVTGATVLAVAVSAYVISLRSPESSVPRLETTNAPSAVRPAAQAGFSPASGALGMAAQSTGTAGRQENVGVGDDAADVPPVAGVDQRLVITSNPDGARVTVDGIGWGVTPLTIRHLPPGDKIVRVTKDGYVASERRVQLGSPGGTPSVRLTLRRREPVRELSLP